MNQESKDYFGRPAGEPGEPGLFLHIADLEPVLELAPGITTRPIVGTNLLASFVRYEPNAVAPLHSHVEEQLFMVFEGEIELELSGERRVLRPGDAALIPAGRGPGVSARCVQPAATRDARHDRQAGQLTQPSGVTGRGREQAWSRSPTAGSKAQLS
jgi:quercetin dioxygenase-like cupin family protein